MYVPHEELRNAGLYRYFVFNLLFAQRFDILIAQRKSPHEAGFYIASVSDPAAIWGNNQMILNIHPLSSKQVGMKADNVK